MKRLKRMGLRRLGGKRGFTLIELLIVMVILAILAGIVIISVGGVIGRGQQTAYNADSENMQTAVLAHFAENSAWPLVNEGVAQITVGGTAYEIIDACAMVGADLYLISIPRSCGDVAADDTDNCDGVAGCTCAGSYVWGLDTAAGGTIYSSCTGSGCDAAATDGFQGVFP